MNAKVVNVMKCLGQEKVQAVRHNIKLMNNKFKLRLNIEETTVRITIGTTIGENTYSNADLVFNSWESAVEGLLQTHAALGGRLIKTNTKAHKDKVFGIEYIPSEIASHIQIKQKEHMFRFV